jgi:nucleoside-diphosphate-sugar epimerase
VFAGQLGIEWIWARLFSVYGPGDNPNSLIPYLLLSLTNGQIPILSQCCHKWDYLYASDAAKALRLLGSISQINSIYNIASGDNRSLRYYAEKLRDIVAPGAILGYGLSNIMAVPLEASIDKIREDTGWEAAVGFDDGIRNTFNHFKITV